MLESKVARSGGILSILRTVAKILRTFLNSETSIFCTWPMILLFGPQPTNLILET